MPVHCLLVIIVHFDVELHQSEMLSEFLNGQLYHEVHMEVQEDVTGANFKSTTCELVQLHTYGERFRETRIKRWSCSWNVLELAVVLVLCALISSVEMTKTFWLSFLTKMTSLCCIYRFWNLLDGCRALWEVWRWKVSMKKPVLRAGNRLSSPREEKQQVV